MPSTQKAGHRPAPAGSRIRDDGGDERPAQRGIDLQAQRRQLDRDVRVEPVARDRIESGVIGGQWSGLKNTEDIELEWQVLRADLQENLQDMNRRGVNAELIGQLEALDLSAQASGERVLFVPTFYAWGLVS